MRLLTLLVLLLATVAVYSDDDVKTGDIEELEGSEETEEPNWEDDGVMTVEADNFENFIDENEYVLVEFYAPWCGHCKSFAPEYAKLANYLEEHSSPIKVVKVDATKDSKYADEYGIKGYPTLKLFRSGKPSEYWGLKQISNIVSWLNRKTGPAAVEIENVTDAEAFIKSKDVVVLGFFKDYESVEAETFIAAADSIDDFLFGITGSEDVYRKYGATSDSMILFKNFDEEKTVFQGQWSETAIREFVAINAAPLIIDFNRNLGHSVFNVLHFHVLIFISKEQGHFEKYVEPTKDVAKEFRGKAVFVAIDSDLNEYGNVLSFFNLKKDDSPTIRLVQFVNEANVKYKPKSVDLSPENIRSFVQDALDGKLRVDLISQKLPEDWDKKPVKTLVASNFEDVAFDSDKDVFVAFCSPWTDGFEEFKPILDELGEKYKDSETVIVAQFDVSGNELDPKHPKITSIPTIIFYKKWDNSVVHYTGKKTVDGFVKFIESGGDLIEYDDEEDVVEENEEDEVEEAEVEENEVERDVVEGDEEEEDDVEEYNLEEYEDRDEL